MNRRWIGFMLGLLLMLGACTGGGQMATQAPIDEVVATTVAPPATAVPATATPEPPTPTSEPPTETPGLPTPTPGPVDVLVDVPYIDDGNPLHLAAIYLPAEAEGPFPTVVIYHSGMFWYGDAEYLAAYEEVGRFFAGRGYAAVVPAYRLSETDPYPAAVEDAFCAMAWVHASADAYGFDVARVAAFGLDAGGNLAAMVGTVDEPERFLAACPHSLPEQAWVHAVAAINGYYDLPLLLMSSYDLSLYLFINAYMQGLPESYIQWVADQGYPISAATIAQAQGTPEEIAERYAEASPVTWVDGSEPPFLLIRNVITYSPLFNYDVLSQGFLDVLAANAVPVETIRVLSKMLALLPAPQGSTYQPVLGDYGIPEAEAFFTERFGMVE